MITRDGEIFKRWAVAYAEGQIVGTWAAIKTATNASNSNLEGDSNNVSFSNILLDYRINNRTKCGIDLKCDKKGIKEKLKRPENLHLTLQNEEKKWRKKTRKSFPLSPKSSDKLCTHS